MRSKNTIINALTNIIGQLIILVMNFVSRKLFLHILDINYLGISGLFSNVITMLSLAELGIGTAITFSLYKPLVEKDEETILALMNLFKKIYRIIGIAVLVVGIAITPLALFMTNLEVKIPHLAFIYILFVINTSVSYFYSYSRTLIVADQKEYRLAFIDYSSKILLVVFQMAFLYLTKNYYGYLIIQILMTFFQNYFIYRKVNKLYPVMLSKSKPRLSHNALQTLKKNTLAMMIYKFAVVVVSGTDNLIISKALNTVWVGLYSNYSMVILSVQTIVSKVVSATTASIGNIVVNNDTKKSYTIYETLQYICFMIYGIASICFIVLLNPFIHLVYGSKYVIDFTTVIILIINFYLLGMQGGSSNFRDAYGLFWQGKFRPMLQGLLNLVISIALVKVMHNLTAVFLGTILSRILTITWFDPYIVHKYGFKSLDNLKIFCFKYIRYIIFTVATCAITYKIAYLYDVNSLVGFIYKCIICAIVPGILFLLLTFNTPEFKFLISKLKSIFVRPKTGGKK